MWVRLFSFVEKVISWYDFFPQCNAQQLDIFLSYIFTFFPVSAKAVFLGHPSSFPHPSTTIPSSARTVVLMHTARCWCMSCSFSWIYTRFAHLKGALVTNYIHIYFCRLALVTEDITLRIFFLLPKSIGFQWLPYCFLKIEFSCPSFLIDQSIPWGLGRVTPENTKSGSIWFIYVFLNGERYQWKLANWAGLKCTNIFRKEKTEKYCNKTYLCTTTSLFQNEE